MQMAATVVWMGRVWAGFGSVAECFRMGNVIHLETNFERDFGSGFKQSKTAGCVARREALDGLGDEFVSLVG